MENGNGDKTSFFKKILNFIKKNPAMSGTLATVSLYAILVIGFIVVIVVLMQLIFTAFSTLSGVFEKMFTSGEYKDLTLEEMQDPDFDFGNCYINSSDTWIGGVWDSIVSNLAPGINHQCEVVALVKDSIRKHEVLYNLQGFDLELSPGLAVSTIIYGYSSQPRVEGEKAIDAGQPMEVLADIVKDGIIKPTDIDEMVNNMILTEGFWYYNCESTKCTSTGVEIKDGASTTDAQNGKKCVRNYYFNATFSREKYMVYLLYGSQAAAFYEMSYNHNKSINYICDECYKKWYDDEYYNIKINLDKYNINLDDINTNEDNQTVNTISNTLTIGQEEIQIYKKESQDFLLNLKSLLTGTILNVYDYVSDDPIVYTYKDGFIYNTFPNYKKAFDEGTLKENQFDVFGTITNSLVSIKSYETAINKIYGLDEIPTMVDTNARVSVAIETKDLACPSEESCNCSNGNLRPSGGSFENGVITNLENIESFDDETICNMLENGSTEKNIRLTICNNKGYDPSVMLPGGYTVQTINGEERYVAKEAITLQQYLSGISETEISGNYYPVESVKFQMLIAQTYLLNSIQRNSTKLINGTEFLVKTGECFQSYNNTKYNVGYVNGNKKDHIDLAYNGIKTQLLVNSETSKIVFAEYGSKLQNTIKIMGDMGLSYVNILDSNYIRTYSKGNGKNYANAKLVTCRPVGQLIANARQFVGFTREQMTSYFPITEYDDGSYSSWCAKFVSYILDLTPGTGITQRSSSVSTFLTYFKNNNRFCSSKYWYDETGNYGCEDSPKTGDIVIFAGSSCGYTGNGNLPAKSDTCWRHIGIVSAVNGDSVTYIHGNTGDCGTNGVCESTKSLNDKTIVGYGR